jgi:hypothetical protein
MSAADGHLKMRSAPDLARAHAVLRFAFGVTFAFVVAELLQWTPTFLPAVLVAIVLVNVPVRPTVKISLGLILIITAAALLAVFLSAITRGAPVILFGIAALVVFHALFAIAQGRPIIGPLMLLICVTAIPVVALESQAVAEAFALAMVRSICFAILVVWLCYLILPRTAPPRPVSKVPPPARIVAFKFALLGTAILAPLMLVYLMFGFTHALPVLVATSMIVASLDFNKGRMQALGLTVGNFAGGVVSLVLFLLLVIQPSVITLTLLVLAAALLFGWQITSPHPLAPVAVVAFNATLIVFSSSLLTDNGTFAIWITRLMQFLFACAFAVGMMVLFWPRNSEPAQAPTPNDN